MFDILRYPQKIITILCFCLMGSICYSQSLSIDTFYESALDLTARTKSVKDANGVYCALVKVISSDAITKVEGNVIESFDNGNEYWIYLSSGTKQIKIFTQHHSPLHIYIPDYLQHGVTSQSSYLLKLKSDLPVEVLYGTNPLAPISMSKDGEPILPKWWNTTEDGMYVGISLPTLDGEKAKLAAIANAIYSYVLAKGCSVEYAADLYHSEADLTFDDVVERSSGLCGKYSIQIAQEYYNSNGEYFVLCAIDKDNNSNNKTKLYRSLATEDENVRLFIQISTQAKINRIPLDLDVQYSLYCGKNETSYNLIVNGKHIGDNTIINNNSDDIANLNLNGPLGLSQLRILTSLPILPDSILYEHASWGSESAYEQRTRISGTGMSIPRIVRLTDFKNGQCGFSINEHFPLDIVSKTTMNPSTQNTILQETGLSDTYFREYSDNDGNNTAIKVEGYIVSPRPMEVKKNLAFIDAVHASISWIQQDLAQNCSPVEVSSEISADMSDLMRHSIITKVRVYPLWYLDPEQRVGNVDKKYRKRYNENKERYPNMVSIIIPLNKVNSK